MKKHPLLVEAIEKSKIAATSTRGMYPVTTASNVYTQDGTSLEEKIGKDESINESSEEVEETVEE